MAALATLTINITITKNNAVLKFGSELCFMNATRKNCYKSVPQSKRIPSTNCVQISDTFDDF